jgi:LPS sulfotransferase NodH
MTIAGNPISEIFAPDDAIRASAIQDLSDNHPKFYVMFLIARSGSTWLTDLVRNTGKLGVPQEWLNIDFCQKDKLSLGCPPPKVFGSNGLEDYFAHLRGHSQAENGAFGVQLDWSHTQWLAELAEPSVDWRKVLNNVFYIRRRDIVLQAISLYRSCASGLFHSYQMSNTLKSAYDDTPYDKERIGSFLQDLARDERRFEVLFRRLGLTPVRLVYEDWKDAPENVLETIGERLGVAGPWEPETRDVRVISDDRNQEWANRFREEAVDLLDRIEARRPPI